MQKHAQHHLGENAKVEQIGSILIDGVRFYVLLFRSGNTLYQALYSLNSDMSIRFD